MSSNAFHILPRAWPTDESGPCCCWAGCDRVIRRDNILSLSPIDEIELAKNMAVIIFPNGRGYGQIERTRKNLLYINRIHDATNGEV